MYVSEICAEGICVTFPWWLKNVKSRSKIPLFSNERHFEIWFPKKKTITFLWSKLSKLHKKDPILHVATTFSLKQGETRTSRGPIPHPLKPHEPWVFEWLCLNYTHVGHTLLCNNQNVISSLKQKSIKSIEINFSSNLTNKWTSIYRTKLPLTFCVVSFWL